MSTREWAVRPLGKREDLVWAHVTMASVVVHGASDESEYARRFAAEPDDNRRTAFLIWYTDARGEGERAVGRLRMRVAGDRAVVWALGLLPREEGAPAGEALAEAIEQAARRLGARRLVAEVDRHDAARFADAGYRRRKERIMMEAALAARPVAREVRLRHPRPDDPAELQAMGALLYEGYRGTIDDDGETAEETADEVRRLVRGDYGDFLVEGSYVLDGRDALAGGAWVTREDHETALLTEVVVHPAYRGRGYSRSLIQAAMNACLARGMRKMLLMVTRGNEPAEGLYRRMGFVEIEGTDEVHMEKQIEEQGRSWSTA